MVFGLHCIGTVLDIYCDVIKHRFHNDLLIVEDNLAIGRTETRGKTLADHIAPYIVALKHVHQLRANPPVDISYVSK